MGIQYHEDEAVLEVCDDDLTDDDFDDDEFAETTILEDDDNSGDDAYSAEGAVDDFVGENSVVFDVDNLVAEFEAECGTGGNPSSRLRRRLEALAERKRRHNDLVDFDDYDIDH